MLSDLAGLMQQVVADSEAKHQGIIESLQQVFLTLRERRDGNTPKPRIRTGVPLDLKVRY